MFDEDNVSKIRSKGELNFSNIHTEIFTFCSFVPISPDNFYNCRAVIESLSLLFESCVQVVISFHFHENSLLPVQIVQAYIFIFAIH